MNNKNQPSYAALGKNSSYRKTKTPLLEKLAGWIRNFLENAE